MVELTRSRRLMVRRLYEGDLLSVAEIAALAGIHPATVRRHAQAGDWVRRGPGGKMPGGTPAMRTLRVMTGLEAGPEVDRAVLIGRLWAALDRHLQEEEAGLHDADPRRPQTLDVLVRTIERLSGLERARHEETGAAPQFDVAATREELLKRIEGLLAEAGPE